MTAAVPSPLPVARDGLLTYALKVAPFERSALETRLKESSSRVLAAADDPDVVRFTDNNGTIVEVRAQ